MLPQQFERLTLNSQSMHLTFHLCFYFSLHTIHRSAKELDSIHNITLNDVFWSADGRVLIEQTLTILSGMELHLMHPSDNLSPSPATPINSTFSFNSLPTPDQLEAFKQFHAEMNRMEKYNSSASTLSTISSSLLSLFQHQIPDIPLLFSSLNSSLYGFFPFNLLFMKSYFSFHFPSFLLFLSIFLLTIHYRSSHTSPPNLQTNLE